MKVKLIDHMGSDLSVVNAARVSFAKHHDEFDEERDAKLIRYLARHGHWTPFGHTSVTIHVKAPIFVARQLAKHQVGLVWNEVSRRYVDDEPEVFMPSVWRKKPEGSIKQGSGESFSAESGARISKVLYVLHETALAGYEALLEYGVAPEQARMILPQSMYTEWYWTGSIAAWARVCKLRLDPHAQQETRDVAEQIDEVMKELFPISWKELMNTDD